MAYGILAVDSITNSDGFTLGGSGATMKNRIINGAMVIDQRNAGANVAITGADTFQLDRWTAAIQSSGTGRFSIQQSTTVPTGFRNSLAITVTTADASPSASFAYHVNQPIEGFNTSDLGFGTASASTVTLSFWVRSSVTGTLPITIANAASTRVYGATYVVDAANTYEYKTITIPGDTTGTWLTDNGLGIRVLFGLGGGSSRTVSAGWQTVGGTFQTNVTGCTSIIGTNGATFYITGVQLEAGSTATSFDYRQHGSELALCQRYFQKETSRPIGKAIVNNQSSAIQLPVSMRVAPTVTSASFSSSNGGTVGTCAIEDTGTGAFAYVNSNANASINFNYLISYSASSEL
jgi:hypothetical protein